MRRLGLVLRRRSRAIRQPCFPPAASRRSSLICSYMLRRRWWRMKWPEALGDRLDELDLALHERAAIALRRRLPVGHAETADRGVLDPDLGAVDVRRLFEFGGLEDVRAVGDLGLAAIGVLPARRDGLDDLAEDLLQGDVVDAEDLLDAVEAAQLLGPLVEGGEEGVDGRRGALVGHVAASLLGRLALLDGAVPGEDRPLDRRVGGPLSSGPGPGTEDRPASPDGRGEAGREFAALAGDQTQPRSLQALATRLTEMT